MKQYNWPFFITVWAIAGLLTLLAGPAWGLLPLVVLVVLSVVEA